MSRLTPLDLIFLMVEDYHMPLHMTACLIFEPPARQQGSTFVRKVIEAFRATEAHTPFNRKLKWLEGGVARWETVQPDMNFHVRHLALPPPGSTKQLDELLEIINSPLLDRAYPLWQCFVIEGLEDGRFALFFKLHHALIDGMGALRAFGNTMADDPGDKEIRPIWHPACSPPRRKSPPASETQVQKFVGQLNGLRSGVLDLASSLMDLGAQVVGRKPRTISLPFRAPETPFNVHTTSTARRYASCELPLERVKSISKANGCTVNDVIMAVVDDALQHYLRGHGRGTDQALVSAMAFSTRSDAHGSSGNQVGADLVTLGDPGAPIAKRLQQVHAATTGVKEKAQQMPLALRQLNSLLLFGAATIPNLPGMVKPAPTYNLLMSNMVGPRDRLYLGGAPLVGMLGLPIVPPNPGLNVTFVSLYDQICLAVGATPNTMPDPENFIELLKASFAELEQTLAPDQPVAKKAPRKKTGATRAAKKSAARKRSPARKTRNNKAAAAES